VTVIQDHDGETHLTPDDLGNPHTLFLAVDLAYPQDVLVALIQQALREAIGERSALLKRNPRKRHRADKADVGLAVYDMVLAGTTFGAIAAKLMRPVSSVKSAYLSTCWKIPDFAADGAEYRRCRVQIAADHGATCNSRATAKGTACGCESAWLGALTPLG
jgi:hypothetical protein